VSGARVAILGLTFKENCPDLRNSKVVDIIDELQEYCCEVLVHDPLADPSEAHEEYGISLCQWEDLKNCQAVILAVPHRQYLSQSVSEFAAIMDKGATLIDIKCVLNRAEVDAAKLNIWRL
jgi:UDP-N-acetyl-D-galactosamine dehydrogenase